MKKFTKLTALMLCMAAVSSILPAVAGAKSLSWVGAQMDYRRKLLYEPEFKTYIKGSAHDYVYYGAKFEPRSGIYIGTPYDRKYQGIKNAIDTSYDWFVPSDEIKNENVPRKEIAEVPSDHTELIGLNWNFALKNSKVINIEDYKNYIYNKIDEIASWGKDVLLIFGKEMNIDDNFNIPELFIECFRFVADYAHTKENIAMVWAPNDTGGLDTTLKEYYPGDEYTDWIGCSLYTMPFFQGNPNVDDAANMSFIMGDYANPAMRAKMIVRFMEEEGINKPIMITEGGVGFESPKGIDYTDWAKHQLRMYYADICRMYPEVKCIISFNQYVIGDLYRYDMGSHPGLLPLVQEVTSDPIYLKDYPSSSPYSYVELTDGTIFKDVIEVSSYAYRPKKQNLVVRYLIDGKWISEKTEPPYEIRLDNSFVPYGDHTLTCEIYDGTGIVASKSYKISFYPADNKSVYEDEVDNGLCRYDDMADKPAQMKNAVALLTDAGIVTGIGDNKFAPDSFFSRSELATMMIRLYGIEESDEYCGFTDVNESQWEYGAINAAVKAGLVDGYDDGKFRGRKDITRYEFTAIAARILQKELGITVPNLVLTYPDEIVDWAADYVRIAKDCGMLLERSDGIFNGSGYISRGDAAIMMAKLYEKIK